MEDKLKKCIVLAIDRVRQIIPIEYQSTFEENLKTIDFVINDKEDEGIPLYLSCHYDAVNNKIYISNNLITDEHIEDLLVSLIHELIHSSSSKHDKVTNKTDCGFISEKSYIGSESDWKVNLNVDMLLMEGMTDYLTWGHQLAIDNKNANFYLFERCIVKQLMLILGHDFLIDCYFNHQGWAIIKKELGKYLDDEEIDNLSYYLFFYQRKKLNKLLDKPYMAKMQHILTKSFINSLKEKESATKSEYIESFRESIFDNNKVKRSANYVVKFPNLNEEIKYFEDEVSIFRVKKYK